MSARRDPAVSVVGSRRIFKLVEQFHLVLRRQEPVDQPDGLSLVAGPMRPFHSCLSICPAHRQEYRPRIVWGVLPG